MDKELEKKRRRFRKVQAMRLEYLRKTILEELKGESYKIKKCNDYDKYKEIREYVDLFN